jgi:hypothetical protein
VWYVSGDDNPQGNEAGAADALGEVLQQIKTAKGKGAFSGGQKAVIVVNGILTPDTEPTSSKSLVSITGSGVYPPLVLRGGGQGGTLDAQNKMRGLNIIGNDVTIADGLVIIRGNSNTKGDTRGGGVYLENAFLTMTGGVIADSTSINGAGVCLFPDNQGNPSTFTM